MKKLPIGVSTLREIIEEGYTYLDKTRIVHQLVESGKYYFFSQGPTFSVQGRGISIVPFMRSSIPALHTHGFGLKL
ncbi:AAA family ATPase [Desulfonatronospira sp.]|uniref:AAA family ATPase n=1 Tax=Desulfonatronospira sp. TaxID=1962951 RepID=UPI0025C4DE72|nr:AAA family ATPase [Desulfonatronospira sp.]